MNGKWSKENFIVFHENNPEVYELFKRFALEASSMRTRYSARGIFHRIRWETMMNNTDEIYKIDDGWSPHYARMFMEEYPDLDGFFETRVRTESYHSHD